MTGREQGGSLCAGVTPLGTASGSGRGAASESGGGVSVKSEIPLFRGVCAFSLWDIADAIEVRMRQCLCWGYPLFVIVFQELAEEIEGLVAAFAGILRGYEASPRFCSIALHVFSARIFDCSPETHTPLWPSAWSDRDFHHLGRTSRCTRGCRSCPARIQFLLLE